ncbi:ankyrin repeat and SAM domain-containing protein 1A-like isoform X2 [Planococcus citri]|uniref:ankyrin repeat and SAM domain-containing protein 1A-like isoform X2 n=1 Tax=Planococcus citri TaxID=170843 RepID=UPI0031F81AB6
MGKDQELLEAARSGNVPIVEKILSQKAKRSGPLASLRRGPGANVQDTSGYSALHHAALNGHKKIVELLLTNEASANIVDVKGSSPLHLAAWSGNVDIVRMLLCHGPSIPNVNLMTKDNETALHCAAQYGHTEVVCLLLEHSCDPTIKNNKYETALDLAAQYGRLETVDLLVRTHPELIQPYNGPSSVNSIFPHTPLHLASRNGHKAVVEVLLEGGMNVNVRTGSGTALHEAALCGKTEVVRTLLENGIDLNIRDAQNNTVIEVLKQFPCHVVHDIYSLIKKYRAMYNERDDLFPTSLLGSPFDNLDSASPSSVSSMYYDSYERRLSSSCSISTASDILHNRYSSYNQPGLSKSLMDTNYLQDDLSCSRSRDFDSVSVCSTASSSCSRDRRSPYNMHGTSGQLPSPGSLSNKISPTPPKKPPRRNLSISPTHATSGMLLSSDQNGYDSCDYAYIRNSSQDQLEYSDGQMTNGNRKTRDGVLRRGKSAEHYGDNKFRHSVMIDVNEKPNVMVRGKSEDLQLLDPKFQPIAITSVHGNIPYRTTNPRRKLRRHTNDKLSDGYDPSVILSRGDLPFRKVNEPNRSPITIERIIVASADRTNSNTMKSSQESLLNDHGNVRRQPLRNCPLSPTHYQQPPTPDHPPPSAVQAEKRIHDRIRPLSQEYSNLKRKSRDIETETEEELLLLVFPGTAYDATSNGSLSSSVSLSDKSVSTDNNTVEEYVGDVPFAGLFKGSITPEVETSANYNKLVRPTTLRQLKNIYNPDEYAENGCRDGKSADYTVSVSPTNNRGVTNNSASTNGTDKNVSMSILSPFDEQEEWAKISEIMASFGKTFNHESIVTELEQEFETRLGINRAESQQNHIETSPVVHTSVSQWLTWLGLPEYENAFINFGYDDINFINGVINDCDLKEIGVMNENDRENVLKQIYSLPNRVGDFWMSTKSAVTGDVTKDLVKEWLDSIGLACYLETFRKNLFTEMDRIKRIWEVELTAVLEITKPGHRRRMLASVNVGKLQCAQSINDPSLSSNLDDLHADLDQLKNNIQELEDEIRTKSTPSSTTTTNTGNTTSATTVPSESGTLRHRKKSRPAPPPPPLAEPDVEIRNPSELLVGVPATLKTQWPHKPKALVTGTVDYVALYLGSTVVKELRGTESTKKSIQKLKKSTSIVDCRVTYDIILAISYRGVKFLNVSDHSLICEHEIRNIHCACQDSEDLTHFAYITKDRASKTHYCHVFCVQTMDQAFEVILTLGEAFEVAYQMALKEHFGGNSRSASNHTRSHSVNTINYPNAESQSSHSRSHSINDILDGGSSSGGGPSTGITTKNVHARSHSVTDIKILNGNGLSKGLSLASPTKAPIAVTEDI